MDDRSLLGAPLEALRDTLVTLAHTLVWPPAARRYCERCNVPPITLESDWSDAVTALSDDWEGLGDAEKLAQVLLHLEGVYHATDAVLDHESPEAGIELARRLIQPILFAKLRDKGRFASCHCRATFTTRRHSRCRTGSAASQPSSRPRASFSSPAARSAHVSRSRTPSTSRSICCRSSRASFRESTSSSAGTSVRRAPTRERRRSPSRRTDNSTRRATARGTVIRGLVLIALTLATGCVAGVGVGGGFTRGDPPPSTTARGFYRRYSAGGGYGTKSVIGQVLGEAADIGPRFVGGAAVELAVIPRPEEVVSPSTDYKGQGHGGIALLGRSAYYAGADDLRALELSVGAGLASWLPEHGAISGGVYLTSYRLDEPGGTVSWSHGIVVSFTVAIVAAIRTPR